MIHGIVGNTLYFEGLVHLSSVIISPDEKKDYLEAGIKEYNSLLELTDAYGEYIIKKKRNEQNS